MATGAARWLAPLGAATAVLVAILGPALVGAATTPRAGRGPTPDHNLDRRLPPDRLSLPAPGPDDRRDSRSRTDLVITGYSQAGTLLTVFYRVGPRSDCSIEVQRPRVAELPTSVLVGLERARPRRPDEQCHGQFLRASVGIRLAGPMAGRVVRDMGRRGALVPLAGAPRSS